MATPNKKRIKELVFSKEDMITKKKLTKFMLGHDISF